MQPQKFIQVQSPAGLTISWSYLIAIRKEKCKVYFLR